MRWSNLKNNKCPKCNKNLSIFYSTDTHNFECSCGFRIKEQRFKEIVSGIKEREINSFSRETTLEELNNL